MAKAQPAKKATKSSPKKAAVKGQPDGTRQAHVMTSGLKVNGIWQDGRLCCPTCIRKLPVGPNTQERLEKRRQRQETLKERAQEQFRVIADMIKKNAKRLGEEEPSDAEIAKMMAAAGQAT